MSQGRGRVLLVDDDDNILKCCARILNRAGISTDPVSSPTTALEKIGCARYDAIVSDLRMPGLDGIELLRAARHVDAGIPFVIMTGSPSLDSAISAVELGAVRYLQKPFEPDELAKVVMTAVSRRVGSEDLGQLDARLNHALDELWMAYQPIVDVARRRVFSYEALFRTAAKDVSGPKEMLELAEKTHRLFDVGRTIRARVATDIAALSPETLAFVNLHPTDLGDPDLYRSDAPLSLRASQVVLEITERAPLSKSADLPQCLNALRALGYRLAIDDIGAGYSGLTSLADVRPAFVKVDASLVRGIDTDPARQVVISSLVAAARSLDTQVVAEAIENAPERRRLSSLGIQLMQGYFFGRPERPFSTPRLAEPDSSEQEGPSR